ncbi:hypothetical protein EUTSA_v10002931mg [Eutrema salsugineum]|uniref:Cytochrome c-type biogenesis protein CcmF C-terminal domain-containing protein n=1 Tax=Eutrema salsugineum TaxID=72664 RepID=V4MX01_EUTSA|nr:hypothetical protein EUTSA_v10002931mg [Eutrema salsugineum]
MVQLHNFFFLILFMVVPCVTAAPVLLKWFVSRDVPTGAPFSNGTIIPIPISSFPLLVYLHSRKIIRSMDGAKSGVLMRCSGHPHLDLERRVEGFGPIAFPVPPELGGACVGGVPPEIGLEALALPRSRQLMAMAVGHDYYQKVPMKMNISHEGVCICMLGVLLSCDPAAYLLGLLISPKLPPVFDPSCMRQKLVPRTVWRPSPTPAVMVRLRSTNTKKIQFTQQLPLGSELHMGKERCCLRGLDHLHGPTSHSICGNLMICKPSLTNDRLIKKYFREKTSTAEVAIHTNLFTDLYASIGTGSSRTGGWYTTIMKLPFIFFIRIGFMLASLGGSPSLLRQLQKDKLRWNRESSVEFIT